ncbi:MAG: hypothetical protein IT349_09780 [Candidatus Eisenbacteria bacterium]|nr:hypothetical protein [Candidatus Eisenbacteria bacterium]MCC7142377.1 hypothetical protein [Candidatus Eisenbacteria bacterium]
MKGSAETGPPARGAARPQARDASIDARSRARLTALLASFALLAQASPAWAGSDDAAWIAGRAIALTAGVLVAALVALTRTGSRVRLIPAIGLYLLFGSLFRYGLIDDAYISLRYAGNLAAGDGLVWNPGERVEGYTSFLWVVVLGLLHAVTRIPLELLATAGSIGCGIGCLVAVDRLATRLSRDRRPSSLPSLLLAAYLPLAFWGFSGMETALFVWLLLAFLERVAAAFDGESLRYRDGLLLAGGLLLCRPEAYAYVPLLLSALARRDPRGLLRGAVGALTLAVPHLVVRRLFYGDFLPNTFYVKVDFSSAQLMAHGISYLAEGALPHLPLLVGAVWGLIRLRRGGGPRPQDLLLPLTLATALGIAVYTGGDHFRELRFFLVPSAVLAVMAAPAAAATAPGSARWFRTAGAAGLAVALLLLTVYHRDLGRSSSLQFGAAITRRWRAAGEWLRTQASPGDLLATPVAGAIPFVSGLPTIDMLGLNDRVIARKPVRLGVDSRDHEKFDAAYVLGREPRWIFLGHFAAADLGDAARRCAVMPVYRDLFQHLPRDRYELVTGRSPGAAWTFLRRKD